jgi:hypothetical protein
LYLLLPCPWRRLDLLLLIAFKRRRVESFHSKNPHPPTCKLFNWGVLETRDCTRSLERGRQLLMLQCTHM